MNCPNCSTPMTCGVPHVPYPCTQWECGKCGKIVIIPIQK